MGFTSTNPRFNTEMLTDQGAGAVASPPSGALRILVRSNGLYTKTSGGVEALLSTNATATDSAQGIVTSYFPVIKSAVLSITTNHTMTETDGYEVVEASTSGGNVTVTLSAGSVSAGRIFTLKKTTTDTNKLILSSAGSETLDGVTLSGNTLYIQEQYGWVTVACDGTNWFLVAQGAAPTALSQPVATASGFMTYRHGTTYNGGIAPTVGGFTNATSSGSITNVNGSFIPYQMLDGGWRMGFNFAVTTTGVTATTIFSVTINGITSKNVASFAQAFSGSIFNQQAGVNGVVQPNTNVFQFNTTSNQDNHTWGFNGDIELDSKPTWAY